MHHKYFKLKCFHLSPNVFIKEQKLTDLYDIVVWLGII